MVSCVLEQQRLCARSHTPVRGQQCAASVWRTLQRVAVIVGGWLQALLVWRCYSGSLLGCSSVFGRPAVWWHAQRHGVPVRGQRIGGAGRVVLVW